MGRQPEVLWAQRSDKIYLTVSLPDATDVSVKSEPEGLFSFSAVGAQGEPFSFSLKLYDTISPEGSKTNIGLRNIICSIQKERKGWWKRLLKSEEKPAPYIKVDWNKWCDEDEEESALCKYFCKQFYLSKQTLTTLLELPAADWLPSDDDDNGVNGRDDESSDDGLLYLPDLEKARGK